MTLYIAAGATPATVTVSIPGLGPAIASQKWKRTYNIPANTVISTATAVAVSYQPASIGAVGPMPKTGTYDCRFWSPNNTPANGNAVGKFKGAIHIESNTPVVVYAHTYYGANSGAGMLLPTDTWGYSYTSINSNQDYTNGDNYASWVYVISNKNKTKVEINCPVPIRSQDFLRSANGQVQNGSVINYTSGTPFTVVLDSGQAFQVIGARIGADANGNGGTSSAGYHMTGTTIRSVTNDDGKCFPIAVFAGSSRTDGGLNCGTGGGDNDNQQLFPQQTWGRKYITAPLSSSTSPSNLMTNGYKVVVKDPTTQVRKNGVLQTPVYNNANTALPPYYIWESNTADYIEADKPIAVAQFIAGGNNCLNGGVGDPEMMYLSPIEQAVTNTGFYRNDKYQIQVNYATIVIPTAGMQSLTVDGISFGALPAARKYSYPIANRSGYTAAVVQWNTSTSGTGQTILNSDSAFVGVTYGLGNVESYGYNIGAYFKNINSQSIVHNILDTTTKQHAFTCVGTKADLFISLAYKTTKLVWDFPNVSINDIKNATNITHIKDSVPSQPGVITRLNPNNPNVAAIIPEDSVLNGSRWFYIYRVPRSSYVFDQVGKYSIPFTAQNPNSDACDPTEKFTLEVDVRATPYAHFDTIAGACPSDSMHFVADLTSPDGTYTNKQFFWEIPTATPYKDSLRKIAYLFPVVTKDSTFKVKLTVASEEGCSAVYERNVTIKPSSDTTSFYTLAGYPTVPLFGKLCLNDSVGFGPRNDTIAVKWYWDYGDGHIDSLNNHNTVAHHYDTAGIFTVKHSYRKTGSGTNTCLVAAPDQVVVVHAKPTVVTFPSLGCLNTSGQATFNGIVSIPPATPGTSNNINQYIWNFGDAANASPSNPDVVNNATNVAVNHTYNYATNGFGPYVVKFSAVTENGCRKDTSASITFSVKPAITFAAISDICESQTNASVATATVTNSVGGTGTYVLVGNLPGITNAATGAFDPVVSGTGTFTVRYIHTATSGCIDSADRTFTVKPKPRPRFTFTDPANCLPANGKADFVNTTSPIAGVTYTWDFGTAPGTSTFTGDDATFYYTSEGNYTIKLRATVGGCTGDTTVTASYKITPSISYPGSFAAVCENAAPFAINTATLNNLAGNAGTGVYSGTGVDNSNGTFSPAVAGYSSTPHLITYTYTSAAGCTAAATQSVSVKAKPSPTFTFNAASCLPANGQLDFTNTSGIQGGTTADMSYVWDYNTAAAGTNTGTTINGTFNYPGEGSYTIKLTASYNGCTSDSSATAQVKITPAINYTGTFTPVCENAAPFAINTATVTNLAGNTGTGVYSGTGVDNATGLFTPANAGYSATPYTITYTHTSPAGCVATATRSVTLKAKPYVDFGYPAGGCLDATGLVQFTNASTVASGQALSYSWNFGDPASGSNNTSTQVTPSHNYIQNTYTIKLSVTTADGCAHDTSKTATFNVTPVISVVQPPNSCENSAKNIILTDPAIATITNAASITGGTWAVTGTGVTNNTTGEFNPALAGGGSHTISFQYTSTAGCASAVTPVNIVVNPKPQPAFTLAAADICSGSALGVTDQSVISGGAIARWAYNFGDNNNPAPFTSNPGTFNKIYTYSTTGSNAYTVKLVTTSDKGCMDSTTRTVNVRALPTVLFTAPAAICIAPTTGVAPTQFTSTVSLPANNGTTAYNWNFGDGGTSTQSNPEHTYASSGNYPVSLTVTSQPYGCVATQTVSVSSFYNTPKAGFTVAPLEVCQGTQQVFTSTTNANGANIAGYRWFMGDGQTQGGANVNKTYTTPGDYTATLIVVSDKGCADTIRNNQVKVLLQPKINAGQDFLVPMNTAITFKPTVNSEDVNYLWTPSAFFGASATLKSPSIVANTNQTFTVYAFDKSGKCQASDDVVVKIMRPLKTIPNAFSPNFDGVHDRWVIEELSDYPDCTVEIFNRYGQKVFSSIGYTPDKAWDGRFNGEHVPIGTYYYIINPKHGFNKIAGSVTVLR